MDRIRLSGTYIHACGLLLALGGCANLETVNHRFQYDGAEQAKLRAVSVDANQRFLLSSYGKVDDKSIAAWRACTEPSPDAMGVFGGSIAGGFSNSKTDAQLAAAFAAQAASIGLRTQSITLLRDAQYRLCEEFINGAISGRQLATLQRRFQNIMVANLAIEQLTGYAKPTVTSVGVGGSAGAQAGLAAAQKALDDAKKDLTKKQDAAADAKTKVTDATTAYDTKKAATAAAKAALPPAAATTRNAADKQKKTADGLRKDAEDKRAAALQAWATGDPNAQNLTQIADAADAKATKAEGAAANLKAKADALNKPADDAQDEESKAKTALDAATKAQKDADTAVADAKENIATLEEARDAARATTATGVVSNGSTIVSPPPSAAVSKEVSQAVTDIVDKILKQNYTEDSCMDYLTDSSSSDSQSPAVVLCLFKLGYNARIASGEAPSAAFEESLKSPALQQFAQSILPSVHALNQQNQIDDLNRRYQDLQKKLQEQNSPKQ